MIPRETINLIRDRTQIEDILKRYIPTLKKKGNNFIGLCPFHKEKTPSFVVSPEKKIFRCFGCQTSGNVFTFISKIEGLNFPESVRHVGNIIGIVVADDRNPEQVKEFDILLGINKMALELYSKTLQSPAGKPGLDYLLQRGVSDEGIREFQLGYAPQAWEYLKNNLTKKKIPISKLFTIGLLSKSDKNGRETFYDKFRKRIIFPICDSYDKPIAFGGRIIGDGEPKYLNSPESLLFKKRNILYGFNIAKKYITEMKRAIIVEGYLDVIGCHQEGIKNVVAPLGTALTINQVELLARYCNEIIILFDADSAGIQASLKSLDVIAEKSIDAKVAMLPELDPFDYIIRNGIRKFMAIVDSARNPIDFKIERAMADKGTKDLVVILTQLFTIINELSYESEKGIYLKKISSLLSLDENNIRSDFRSFISKNGSSAQAVMTGGNQSTTKDFYATCYRDLVLLLCRYPDLIEKAALEFSKADITDTCAKNIYSKLIELYTQNEHINIDKLFDFFTDGDEKDFLARNLVLESDIEDPQKAYNEIYVHLRLFHINNQINKYARLIKENDGNKMEFLTEIEVLTREREKLNHYKQNKLN